MQTMTKTWMAIWVAAVFAAASCGNPAIRDGGPDPTSPEPSQPGDEHGNPTVDDTSPAVDFEGVNIPPLPTNVRGELRLRGARTLDYASTAAVVSNVRLLVDGVPTWRWFEEFDTGNVPPGMAEDYFATIVEAFLGTGRGRCGVIGEAGSVLVNAAEIVPFAVQWMEENIR